MERPSSILFILSLAVCFWQTACLSLGNDSSSIILEKNQKIRPSWTKNLAQPGYDVEGIWHKFNFPCSTIDELKEGLSECEARAAHFAQTKIADGIIEDLRSQKTTVNRTLVNELDKTLSNKLKKLIVLGDVYYEKKAPEIVGNEPLYSVYVSLRIHNSDIKKLEIDFLNDLDQK